jgi:hypothetical protein
MAQIRKGERHISAFLVHIMFFICFSKNESIRP